ncbi:hypothetical protein F2Q70_00002677 [Brassica cretica]|uniref:Uncharacterized protein n=1 Tax=Brassica cretica TaxID=69181 RepID=A0A8S9IM37_BRACR|nr:hypothetical protein F2Q70_00002677 [Brassica cretica]
MRVRHNWLVCILHISPTVDKKVLPSNREQFQFSLISKTWKSTRTRALPICTSRPRWSAITLGKMLIDAPVQCMWELNTLHHTRYCKFPTITLLLQCNPILHLVSGLIKHSPNVLFSAPGLSEEHPQSVGKVLPIGSLSTSIGSSASSECVLVVYGRCSSIDGCWSLSIGGGLSLSIDDDGGLCLPIDLGGCGFDKPGNPVLRILPYGYGPVYVVGALVAAGEIGATRVGPWGPPDLYLMVPATKAQGLQPPEHLSSDLLHQADDPPGHAGFHCYLVQVSKAQQSLAAQYRSMS